MGRFRSREKAAAFNGFSNAELDKMDKLLKKWGEETLENNFCYKVATNFNNCSSRAGKPVVKWTEVHSWFQSRIHDYPCKPISTVCTSERFSTTSEVSPAELSKKIRQTEGGKRSGTRKREFEARSNKEGAWYDVHMFLALRIVSSGEAEVRVRFCGFGPEEDEWINIKNSVRECSRPLKSSECQKLNVGDYVLCFQETKDHALHLDAHVLEIERRPHGSRSCKCLFLVRYDHNNTEERVRLRTLSCRPTF